MKLKNGKGKIGRAVRGGPLVGLLSAACLFAPQATAVAVVPVFDVNWVHQEALLSEIAGLLESNSLQNAEIIRRIGDTRSTAPILMSNVSSVTSATAAALSIETGEKARERGKTDYALKKTSASTLQSGMKVSASYSVLGTKYDRDAETFEPLAMKDALRDRHQEAIDNLSKVSQEELALQKELLSKLRSAGTESEIQLVQAGLTASQERVALARHKVDQAKDEYGILEAQLQTETERKRLADKEWNETFVDKLRARALTSLHAQKGENF